jgi:pimeloyl-ACP methyl ester carboxylesterase
LSSNLDLSFASALSAPTELIEAASGETFAYRRLGEGYGNPILFFNRFRGNLDDWDPTLLDGLAQSREVLIFDNVGVGRSSGSVPDTIDEAARYAISFVEALGLTRIDLLGFSMGCYVVESFANQRPDLVRRLALTGAGSRSRAGSWSQAVKDAATHDPARPQDNVFLFFTETGESTSAGWRYEERIAARTDDVDLIVTTEAWKQQLKAMSTWANDTERVWKLLEEIRIPSFVANGSDDIMIGSDNTFDLGQRIPFAQTVIYPDSGHGFLFQYSSWFVRQLVEFLDSDFER